MVDLFPLLIFLVVVAAIARADALLTLFYLLAGAYIAGRWWSGRAFQAVGHRRTMAARAFLGESIPVQLEIANAGWLPVLWLRVHDSLPVDLAPQPFFRRVLSLRPRERVRLEYTLHGRKRGYYPVGPMFMQAGDVLGLGEGQRQEVQPDHVTVYPKIVPLAGLRLTSGSPIGDLRHAPPTFEDPSRARGKRDYTTGDSFRRIDWKVTARLGRLQVKQFEPTMSTEAAIVLNLNVNEYDAHTAIDATELAVVTAASVANWLTSRRQAVGLVASGIDPLNPQADIHTLQPHKGRSHLMRLLELLARIQRGPAPPVDQLIQQASVHLSWGATMILILGQASDDLFDRLFQARRAGLHALLVLVGPNAGAQALRHRAKQFGFPLVAIRREQDLETWGVER